MSEFSIIMIVLAQSAGLVSKDISAMVTLVALITILVSTYFMKYDDWIYARVERYLHLFEGRTIKEGPSAKTMIYPLVLFGYQNGGHQFIKTFHEMKLPFVVVDYDPEAIEELEHRHIDYLYGDATDPELLAELDIEKASLIVNTIGDHAVNIALIRYVRRRNDDAVVICYSSDHNHAAELYELGATYVFLPHFIGSEQLSSFIHEYGLDKRNFETVREHHLQEIREHLAAKDDPETEVVEGL